MKAILITYLTTLLFLTFFSNNILAQQAVDLKQEVSQLELFDPNQIYYIISSVINYIILLSGIRLAKWYEPKEELPNFVHLID